MSQTSAPTPAPDDDPSPAASHRRRARRFAIPASSEGQAGFLEDLARRVTPSFDFFLFSLLSGLALAVAIISDAPAFYVLSALLAPFMAPVAGLAFSTVLGSGRFFLRMLSALLIGSLIIFAWGALAGGLSGLFPALRFEQLAYHARFSWPDVALLLLGAWLTAYTLVRSPQQRPLVTSVALAYEIYLPVGVAGFGLTSGLPQIWAPALLVYLLHVSLAALSGALALVVLRLRPRPTASIAAAVLAATAAASLVLLLGRFAPAASGMAPLAPVEASPIPILAVSPTSSLPPTATTPADTPGPSQTPQPPTFTLTSTNTLVPTRTPTITTTPIPTPLWAYVRSEEGGGVIVHESPGFQTGYVASLINGVLVIVLSDAAEADGVTWVRVRTPDGREGWVVRALLSTATPEPGW
jgi:hypothetical protein